MVTRMLVAGFLVLASGGMRMGSAQDVRATARVDSTAILIGDWLRLTVDVESPEHATVAPPVPADSLHGIEIIRQDSPVVRTGDQRRQQSYTFILTSFDSGAHIIPPMRVQYQLEGDSVRQSIATQPIVITVRGITVDTTQEIRDIKPPLSVPLSFAEIAPYLLGAILLGVLLWLILYIRKRRKHNEPLLPEAPGRPPYELALEALRELEAEKLWQRGNVKQYHSQLTDVVRTYIERRFDVPSLEETTDETLAAAPIRDLPRDARNGLEEILVRADLVKFAKFLPAPPDHESSMRQAVTFVESTIQRTAPQAVAEPSGEVGV